MVLFPWCFESSDITRRIHAVSPPPSPIRGRGNHATSQSAGSRNLANGCQLLGGESVQEGPVASVIKTIVMNEYGERIMSPTEEAARSQFILSYMLDISTRQCVLAAL